MSAKTQQERSRAYMARFREAGGVLVAVRMTAEQLASLDALRLPGESRNACVLRVIDDRKFQR